MFKPVPTLSRTILHNPLRISRISCISKSLDVLKSFKHSGDNSVNMVKFLNQSEAANIDKDLFEKYKFSVDQLMELAGQSCAIAIAKCYPPSESSSNAILVCCGPGNNGGDGLVCARHLNLFGYCPEVYYPKRPDNQLYQNLTHQCVENDILLLSNTLDSKAIDKYSLIVDALFGFSFKPPVRKEYAQVMDVLINAKVPICSIDIPSGWNVETGPPTEGDINPQMLISLTAPKLCARSFKGKFHYLGGRFVPEKLERLYQLDLPKFAGTELVISLQ